MRRRSNVAVILLVSAVIGGWLPRSAPNLALGANSATCSTYTGSSLRGFVKAAESEPTCLAPDASLTATAPVTVTRPAILRFNGARVTERGRLPWMLTATAKVTVERATLLGDGLGGGFLCHATTCHVSHVEATGMTTGMRVDSSGLMTVSHCAADDNFDGIITRALGALSVTNTTADDDHRVGFDFAVAGVGSSISGSATDDSVGLLVNGGSELSIGAFMATGDNHYGVDISNSSDGAAASLTAIDTGAAHGHRRQNSGGAGVYLHNVTGWTFDDIASSGMPSYGVAVSASSRNTFEDITIDRAGMGTTNPGLNLDAGTSHNHFVTTTITGMTVGVLIGGSGAKDPGGQVGNVGNHFGTVTLDHESFAAISIPGGRDNLFKTVDATDITSIYPPPDRAQVRLYGAYTRDNRIDEYNSLIDADRAPHHEAFYVIYADKYATGNTVTLGTVDEPGSYSVARWRDANGHNTFT